MTVGSDWEGLLSPAGNFLFFNNFQLLAAENYLEDSFISFMLFCLFFFLHLIQLFIIIGNKRANSFWAGNLPPDEELHMDAPAEKRVAFITQKYKEGKFRKAPFPYKTKEQLNKVILERVSPDHTFCILLYLCAISLCC